MLLQHEHLLLNIFVKPITMSRTGQALLTKSGFNTLVDPNKNTKPINAISPGTTLWCGHEHFCPVCIESIFVFVSS